MKGPLRQPRRPDARKIGIPLRLGRSLDDHQCASHQPAHFSANAGRGVLRQQLDQVGQTRPALEQVQNADRFRFGADGRERLVVQHHQFSLAPGNQQRTRAPDTPGAGQRRAASSHQPVSACRVRVTPDPGASEVRVTQGFPEMLDVELESLGSLLHSDQGLSRSCNGAPDRSAFRHIGPLSFACGPCWKSGVEEAVRTCSPGRGFVNHVL